MKLGGFATQWYRGAGIKKDEIGQEGIPCIRYGEIHTIYKIWFDKCVSHTDETKQPSKKYADYGDILFAITSEDIPFIGNSVAYMGKERIMVGGDIVVMKHTQNPKYISYALSTIDAVSQKGKGKVKSKVVHTNVPSLKEIVIPVPPLPVQEEIVRILDAFTELQAELQAELQKRKQQYNFYRDNLLNFKNINRGGQEIKWMKIGEICNVITGGEVPVDSIKGDTPQGDFKYPIWGNGKDIYGYSATYQITQDAVCISSIGANTGAVFFHSAYFTPIIRLKVLIPLSKKVSTKYLFYILSTIGFDVKKSSVPNMNSTEVKQKRIPIPPLAEQNRIVSILDRFDTLTNDLTSGLPAEIEKRRQQYEFYRDKLLTFKRKEA